MIRITIDWTAIDQDKLPIVIDKKDDGTPNCVLERADARGSIYTFYDTNSFHNETEATGLLIVYLMKGGEGLKDPSKLTLTEEKSQSGYSLGYKIEAK